MNSQRTVQSVAIQQPNVLAVTLEVTGTAPLIQNKFSEKALHEMLRKHMGLSVQKEKKIPAECIERATIYNEDRKVCIPPTAFKKAMLTAAGGIKGLKKGQLRTSIFVEGKSIPIKFSRMVPQMDMVRTSGIGRTPDVRFRPRFEDWSARLTIQFQESIPVQTIADLLNRAGSVGVGEWRPEKDGTFGTFEVTRNITDQAEIKEVTKDCRSLIPALTIPEWALNAEFTPEILEKLGKGNDAEDDE
jgi:hypothetical protein